MRIALLTHQWPGARLGGIGVYTLNAARMLANAGHEPHVFTFTLPEDVRAAVPSNIHLHEVADLAQHAIRGSLPPVLAAAVQAGGEAVYRLALGALLCDQVRRLHKDLPFDLVEAPEYEALALPLLLSPIPNLPIITHLHSGSAIIRRSNHLDPTPDRLLLEATEFAAILAADAVIAPSAQVVADTRESCPIDSATILPLPFEIPADSTPSPPNPLAPILFIGRLEIIKGAHLLPEALNLFLPQHPTATIRLIGPDTASAPAGASMAQWIKSQLHPNLAPRVTFVGEVSRQQISAELAACSFTLVPSLHDNYPYVCCESLAAARPVIVSNHIGATEVVADAGLTFERNNATALAAAITKLWTDPALLHQLSKTARHRATAILSSTATAPRRLNFYEQLITAAPSQIPLSARLAPLPSIYTAPLLQALTRLTMFLAGTPDPALQTPGTRLLAIMNSISQSTKSPAKILLYGAGRHTAKLLAEQHLWQSQGHQIIGLIDDHPRFHSQKTHITFPVESAAALLARAPFTDPALAIVLSTDTFQDQFWNQTAALREKNIPVYRLYP